MSADNRTTTATLENPVSDHSDSFPRPNRTIPLEQSLSLALGSDRAALFVRQLHYRLVDSPGGENRHGQHWVYNSYESWLNDLPAWGTARAVRWVVDSLRTHDDNGDLDTERSVVITEKRQLGNMRYRLNYRRILALCWGANVIPPDWVENGAAGQIDTPITPDMFTSDAVQSDLAKLVDSAPVTTQSSVQNFTRHSTSSGLDTQRQVDLTPSVQSSLYHSSLSGPYRILAAV